MDYLDLESRLAAKLVNARIDEAVNLLMDFPGSGRPGRVAGTRELLIQGSRYVVAYSVRLDHIRILRLLHSAQEWPENL